MLSRLVRLLSSICFKDISLLTACVYPILSNQVDRSFSLCVNILINTETGPICFFCPISTLEEIDLSILKNVSKSNINQPIIISVSKISTINFVDLYFYFEISITNLYTIFVFSRVECNFLIRIIYSNSKFMIKFYRVSFDN